MASTNAGLWGELHKQMMLPGEQLLERRFCATIIVTNPFTYILICVTHSNFGLIGGAERDILCQGKDFAYICTFSIDDPKNMVGETGASSNRGKL